MPDGSTVELVNKILYVHDRTTDYMNSYRQRWYSWYKLYRNYLNLQTFPFKNKIFVPLVFPMIQTIIPRVVGGLLFKYPMMEVQKDSPWTTDEAVQAAANVLNNKWMTDRQTWNAKLSMFQEGLMYGTACAKRYWSKTYKNVPQWSKPITVDGKTVGRQYTGTKKFLHENRPRLEHIDLFDVVPDLESGWDPQFISHLKIAPMDEIRFGAVEYDSQALDELESDGDYRAEASRDGSPRLVRLTSVELDYPDLAYSGINQPRHLIEFTYKKNTPEGIEYWIATIGNRRILLRHEQIPYWPWICFRNNPIQHEMLGVSEIEAIESLQHGNNFYVNMMMDNMLLSGTKMWAFGEGANPDLDNFVVEPMGILMLDDISQFKPIEFSDIPEKSWEMMQVFPEWVQRTIGINDILQGANAPRREYATTTSVIQQASEARIDEKIKLFESSILEPEAGGFLEQAAYELTDKEYVRNTGYSKDASDPKNRKEFNEYEAADLSGMFDVRVASTSIGQNAIYRQQLNEFAKSASDLLGPDCPLQVRSNVLIEIGKTYNQQDLTRILDELPAMVQQAQAAKAAEQAAQQGGAGPQPSQGNQPGPAQTAVNSGIPGLSSLAAATQGAARQSAMQHQ